MGVKSMLGEGRAKLDSTFEGLVPSCPICVDIDAASKGNWGPRSVYDLAGNYRSRTPTGRTAIFLLDLTLSAPLSEW
ncbi:conserved hypothetical protein [Ricinus communis]|uniref:Uncharacterized protein n=1 Tax=Ricinus communis TaxID=3988 RepID=B9T8N0_RICCO|nr:conserved hypothetical protein [Ricinus communis]